MNATPTHVFVFIKNKSAYCDAIERTIQRCIRKCNRSKEISSICSSCVCNVKKYEKAFRKLTSFFFAHCWGAPLTDPFLETFLLLLLPCITTLAGNL